MSKRTVNLILLSIITPPLMVVFFICARNILELMAEAIISGEAKSGVSSTTLVELPLEITNRDATHFTYDKTKLVCGGFKRYCDQYVLVSGKRIPDSEWEYETFISNCIDASNKYKVDLSLMLSQFNWETHFGLNPIGAGVVTKNPGNVGNFNDGTLYDCNTWKQGIDEYARLISTHYNWVNSEGWVTAESICSAYFQRKDNSSLYYTTINATLPDSTYAPKIARTALQIRSFIRNL